MIPACAEKMAVQEAKEVAVTMAETRPFTPPPRTIEDILSVLEKAGPQTLVPGATKRVSDETPPEGEDPSRLMEFYHKRGSTALEVGYEGQALQDLRKANHYAELAGIHDNMLLMRLARTEMAFGQFRRAVSLLEKVRKMHSKSPMVFSMLVSAYAHVQDVKSAKKAYGEAMSKFGRSGTTNRLVLYCISQMSGIICEMEGKWEEAEQHVRKAMDIVHSSPKSTPGGKVSHWRWLSANLLRQERFLEAEFEARQLLMFTLRHFGYHSASILRTVDLLIAVLLGQGRVGEAEKLARAAIGFCERSGVSPRHPAYARARMSLGSVLASKGDFPDAVEQFDSVREALQMNPFAARRYTLKSIAIMLSLVMTGRHDDAMPWISDALQWYRSCFGEAHYVTAEALAVQGLAEARRGRKREALDAFSRALPVLIQHVLEGGRNFQRIQMLRVILEGYLGLLSEIQGAGLEKEFGIDPVAEGFRIADVARNRSVHTALAGSAARAAVTDPALADLIRNEQDAQNAIEAIQEGLVGLLAAPADEQIPGLIEDLRKRMDALVKARGVLLEDIKRRFPKYSELISPGPATVDQVKEGLRPREALVSIYPADDRTYVWVVSSEGGVFHTVSPMTKKDLQEEVIQLRKALDPRPSSLGEIPPFDLGKAHGLYRKLLMPVEKGWKGAKNLVIVAGGPLGQIPFSLLPTTPSALTPERGELFSNYRSVPWLVRKVPITRLPTVSSFLNMRGLPVGDPGRKAFAGFGDPIFSAPQAAGQRPDTGRVSQKMASRGRSVHLRGVRGVKDVDLDSTQLATAGLEDLNPLPDTAEEILSICSTTGGDPNQDVFLGKEASEFRVKATNLSNRRVIVFATHALVPGDLDGLEQPALAFSSPSVTGEKGDGLLTMGEVLKLKLNADWIVLSACNTGAAEGEGAEAVTGLGRAFFYAGTRALLVSMWPVETTSARMLTTGLFRFQRENKNLTRSEALQKAVLEMIDRQVLKDPETGKIVTAYAHPLFWAPFIVVGESFGRN